MKKVFSLMGRCRFLILLLALFIAADTFLGIYFERYIMDGGNFWMNDYEVTRRDNPELVWNKVFYGNSAVIAAYREEVSNSGYINFGVDYGCINSLLTILRSGEVEIGSELVVGLNWAALCDDMETNAGYFWNRSVLEPYSYFQRDRLYEAFTGKLKSLFSGKPWADGRFLEQTKSYYYSCLSKDELTQKVEEYASRYWAVGVQGYRDNLMALEKVVLFCQDRGIRVRIVIMPWNPSVEKPALISELDKAISAVCMKYAVEWLDISNAFDEECFHDLGHLNYEYGAYVFTEEIEEWLSS